MGRGRVGQNMGLCPAVVGHGEGRSWEMDEDLSMQPKLVLDDQVHHGSGLSSLGFKSFLDSWLYVDLN